ncbi:hypothetical protein V8C86DRAFT_2972775 [Haematococcus lacustris]
MQPGQGGTAAVAVAVGGPAAAPPLLLPARPRRTLLPSGSRWRRCTPGPKGRRHPPALHTTTRTSSSSSSTQGILRAYGSSRGREEQLLLLPQHLPRSAPSRPPSPSSSQRCRSSRRTQPLSSPQHQPQCSRSAPPLPWALALGLPPPWMAAALGCQCWTTCWAVRRQPAASSRCRGGRDSAGSQARRGDGSAWQCRGGSSRGGSRVPATSAWPPALLGPGRQAVQPPLLT